MSHGTWRGCVGSAIGVSATPSEPSNRGKEGEGGKTGDSQNKRSRTWLYQRQGDIADAIGRRQKARRLAFSTGFFGAVDEAVRLGGAGAFGDGCQLFQEGDVLF